MFIYLEIWSMKLSIKLVGILAMLAIVLMTAIPAVADSGKPSVAVSDFKVTPAVLMSGDTGTITLKVTNPNTALAGSTTSDSNTYNYGTGYSQGASITHSQTTTTSSSNAPDGAVVLKEVTLVADAPIHVTSQQQYLDWGRLGMGNSAPFSFTIKVDDNAADGTYPLTLKVRTDDSVIYLNYALSVQVDNSQPKVILNDAPGSFTTATQSVVIDILNVRPNQVDSVSVIPTGSDFVFKPIQEYAVGSIGAGQLYTVQFSVSAKNASYSGNPSFKLIYQNGDNWHQTDSLTVYSNHNSALAATADKGDNSLLYLVLIILAAAVILGGVYMYMRSKRAKR